jgi:AraC family transcriptional regulator of adaptative response / DNA-3-methyladenine glycosylase II
MLLDTTICAQARKTRDARFDGRFFTGVLSTGIYCRSICPARTAKEENVRYFPTAAAAAEAGLRPCLRCRPECSPGTPAWLGTSATVSRALRLISESALEDGGIETLAERLGIGGRHLRRLFLQHLGASPIAVAQTRRLHFAKKLIDDSRLPMSEVALASGFGSIRRFNAAFRKTYNRTPTQLRKLGGQASAMSEGEYCFQLRYRPPFDWISMLEFLAPRATPEVEMVENGTYRRVFSLNDDIGWFEAFVDEKNHDETNHAEADHVETNAETNHAVTLRIHYPQPRSLFLIVERVRRMFDLSAEPNEIMRHLSGSAVLARRVKARPGLRVPGSWDGFELAVRAILGQQVTVRGATTLTGRLVREFGVQVTSRRGISHLFPAPEKLVEANFSRVGLTRARALTIRSLARAVCEGDISFSGLNTDEFIARFRELPGIGDWTAQYVAMRAFNEPDAFPASDLGLLRAAGLNNPKQLAARAEAWRPWRAYAAMYLWQTQKSSQKSSLKFRQKGINHDDDNLRYRDQLYPNREPGRAALAGGR